jgi:hypothetical protein
MVMNRVGTNGAEAARTASVLNIIAGIWLIISPFWMGFWQAPAPLWNTLILGIVIGLLALARACYPARNVGLSWVNLLLSIWLIVSPFFLAYPAGTVAVPNNVILGIIVGVLAIWSALATPTYAGYAR